MMTKSTVVDNTQVMIEAQQKVISSRGPLRPIPIKADRAVIAVQKILKRLYKNNGIPPLLHAELGPGFKRS